DLLLRFLVDDCALVGERVEPQGAVGASFRARVIAIGERALALEIQQFREEGAFWLVDLAVRRDEWAEAVGREREHDPDVQPGPARRRLELGPRFRGPP